MTNSGTGSLRRSRYEYFVGLRYIRSHSSNRFISFISMISMLGIALGVAVLIVVLSVMNGFEEELRSRILSMTSHATVSGGDHGLECRIVWGCRRVPVVPAKLAHEIRSRHADCRVDLEGVSLGVGDVPGVTREDGRGRLVTALVGELGAPRPAGAQ